MSPQLKLALLFSCVSAFAQAPPADATKITLQDALERAKRYGAQIQSANIAIALAHEDRSQARAAMLPSVNGLSQFIYTEPNGSPSGVFVSNDGPHVYNDQAIVHQDLFSPLHRADLRRTQAAEAVADARREVAVRGLNATVVQNFYAAVVAGRKLASARTSLEEANRFLDISNKQEHGGEAAHSDVIKAQLQKQQRERDVSNALAAAEKAKVALAVFIFPDITRDFTAVDDLEITPALTDFATIHTEDAPDFKAANSLLAQARAETQSARYALFPNLSLDFFYGINANHFATRSDGHEALGYAGQVTLNIPVWNWGSTQSKVRQARLREDQATADLALAKKQLKANASTYFLEAQSAREQIDSLRSSIALATESLRLTLLRYQAGEANVLEVVDAQTTAAGARDAFSDGLARYRLALANLQTLTGHF